MVKTLETSGYLFKVIQLKNGLVASCSSYGTITIWNIETNELVRAIETGHTRSIVGLLGLRNGSLISSSDDTLIKIWNNYTYSLNRTTIGHTSYVWALAELQKSDDISLKLIVFLANK